jgi:hypothetical protein
MIPFGAASMEVVCSHKNSSSPSSSSSSSSFSVRLLSRGGDAVAVPPPQPTLYDNNSFLCPYLFPLAFAVLVVIPTFLLTLSLTPLIPPSLLVVYDVLVNRTMNYDFNSFSTVSLSLFYPLLITSCLSIFSFTVTFLP